MSRAERVNEILVSMNAFGKADYRKEEVLGELLELQKELVNATFKEKHAENSSLRIWDVERRLEQLNRERGHVADKELAAFEDKCKDVCSLIKSEISGRNGEARAFRSLDGIYGKKYIIKNCEMEGNDERTELDAVVVTPKAIFIVEVKNTGKDIIIDENGDYYRNGVFKNWDCNIGEKMNLKEKLLRNALVEAGFDKDVKIQNIVVFTTSNHIEVVCKYEYIKTCFLSLLPHVINNFRGYPLYSDEDMEAIAAAVEGARCSRAYQIEMDMSQFKLDFAELMAVLEKVSENKEEETKKAAEECPAKTEENNETIISRESLRKATVAIGFAVTLISSLMAANKISKRMSFLFEEA